MTEQCALYFNLDLTLTRMTSDFDTITAETLLDAGVPKENVEPELSTWLFFNRFTSFEPNPRENAFADYFDQFDVDADPEAAAEAYWEAELDAVQPVVDDVRTPLETLGEAFVIGVLTRGVTEIQRAKLETLAVEDVFDDVLISYEVERKKVDGGLFELAEERTDADEYAYVSNSQSDIEAARDAGWQSVAVEFEDLVDDPIETVRDELA